MSLMRHNTIYLSCGSGLYANFLDQPV